MTALDDLIAANTALQQSTTAAKPTKQFAAAVTAWARGLPTPAPAPQPVGELWRWPVADAQPLANQGPADYIRDHLDNGRAVFETDTPVVTPTAAAPLYSFTFNGVTVRVPIPDGTKGGGSNDHHLAVIAPDGTHYGFEHFHGPPYAADGFGVTLPGGVNETHPTNSNAACFDLTGGLISVSDILNWRLHTLVFSIPTTAVAGVASVYPSNANYNDPRCVYGQRVRLNPKGTPSQSQSLIVRYIDASLRTFGAVCRDQGDVPTFYGQDYVNAGGNVAAWQSAGVPLNLAGNGYAIGCYLYGIDWTQLQAVGPPAQA